ncbi:MAG: hypothetical protein A2527_12535 [Candidatus Lambdaproteobacteria bacterium RIFOXYD2_FULL_50_16]|uniref:TRL-like protein family n=1 Tax=Candidatus Lambdaproteobacteria bacterium RIFOXYD2_FULL_50_16 TaxID=1817772 RepID=A0A1F6GAB1_9PROT|nr:MAG: hypothetical protein A2527_12535 [Candidatus Lambdaproteobacteria bacterium RIFOXYD2_FULL_50_16]
MKKVILVFLVALVLASCATVNYAPVNGAFYTEIKGPFGVTGEPGGSKIGEAKCTTYLGMWATGDCSLEAAMTQGGITKITHVDFVGKSVLGVVASFTLVAHGD